MLVEAGDALASRDVDIVRRTAHTLKSNASTFGAIALSSLCAELERSAKEGALSGGPELLTKIESEFALVVDELRSARNQLVGFLSKARHHPSLGSDVTSQAGSSGRKAKDAL